MSDQSPDPPGAINRRQLAWLTALILASSLAGFAFSAFGNRPTVFFSDSDYRWRQIQDLISRGPSDISCTYPARKFDPDLRLLQAAHPVVVRQNQCYYLYPYALSYVFALPVKLLGRNSIFALQQIFSACILFAMVSLGRRMALPFTSILFSLVLFRLGTGHLLQSMDLEEHTLSVLLVVVGTVLTLRATTAKHLLSAGFLAGLAFFFRPGTGIVGLALPLSLLYYDAQLPTFDQTQRTKRIAGLLLGLTASIGLAACINYFLTGHVLGIKVFDPLHHVDLATRALGILTNLFFDARFPANGLLFHMPLLAALGLYARVRYRQGAGAATTGFLIVLVVVCLPVLLVAAPHRPTAAAGFRFAMFLYPIMILLVLRLADRTEVPKWATALATLPSFLLTFGMLFVGLQIEKTLQLMHNQVRQNRADLILVRDLLANQTTATLFLEGPVVMAQSDSELGQLVARAKEQKLESVLIVAHRLRPLPALVPAAARHGAAIDRMQYEHLQMARLTFRQKADPR